MSKKLKLIILFVLLAIISYGVYYAWGSLPGISGYGAKNLCSCIFVAGRDEKKILQDELSDPVLKWGTYKVNMNDSSVTGSVYGFAKRKAIFRQGLGCTLVNDTSEIQLRAQQFILAPPLKINSDTIPWPMGDLISDTQPAGINHAQLQAAVDIAFAEPDPNKKIGTRAVIVLYKGQLVAEKYAAGFTRQTKMLGWSTSKSITAALIGILVKEGKLEVKNPAPVAKWRNVDDERNKITLEILLQQTSGLKFDENYTGPSEAITMLFSKGDMAEYTASLPLKDTPGTVFNYSSGNSNILQGIIKHVLGAGYHRFPYDFLFHKIGMYSALLEPDAAGTFIGSSYMYANARDFARFGLLYYNDGIWNGKRILPEGWVKSSSTSSSADKLKHYGYQFWLNGFDKKDKSKRWYPDVPADMFFADGYGGQEVYIIPSKQLVVVRLGLHVFDENKFLKGVIASLPK